MPKNHPLLYRSEAWKMMHELYEAGMKEKDIAVAFGCSRQFVSEYIGRYISTRMVQLYDSISQREYDEVDDISARITKLETEILELTKLKRKMIRKGTVKEL